MTSVFEYLVGEGRRKFLGIIGSELLSLIDTFACATWRQEGSRAAALCLDLYRKAWW
jgi:hypothetical protein